LKRWYVEVGEINQGGGEVEKFGKSLEKPEARKRTFSSSKGNALNEGGSQPDRPPEPRKTGLKLRRTYEIQRVIIDKLKMGKQAEQSQRLQQQRGKHFMDKRHPWRIEDYEKKTGDVLETAPTPTPKEGGTVFKKDEKTGWTRGGTIRRKKTKPLPGSNDGVGGMVREQSRGGKENGRLKLASEKPKDIPGKKKVDDGTMTGTTRKTG